MRGISASSFFFFTAGFFFSSVSSAWVCSSSGFSCLRDQCRLTEVQLSFALVFAGALVSSARPGHMATLDEDGLVAGTESFFSSFFSSFLSSLSSFFGAGFLAFACRAQIRNFSSTQYGSTNPRRVLSLGIESSSESSESDSSLLRASPKARQTTFRPRLAVPGPPPGLGPFSFSLLRQNAQLFGTRKPPRHEKTCHIARCEIPSLFLLFFLFTLLLLVLAIDGKKSAIEIWSSRHREKGCMRFNSFRA